MVWGPWKKWEEMGLKIYLEEQGPKRKRDSSLQEGWKEMDVVASESVNLVVAKFYLVTFLL